MRACGRNFEFCWSRRPTGSGGTTQSRRLPPLNHSEIVSFLWGAADLIRDSFKRGKYQDVILPLTVLRRLDCVLAPTKEKVLRRQAELRGRGLDDLDPQLRRASGFAFYNTSRYDFETLLADAPHLAANLRMEKVCEAIDRLKELRTVLISAAVTGKIDVREAIP